MNSKNVFFNVSFSASNLLDSETRFDDINGELINIGIQFDNWDYDEVIGCVGSTFVTEKLYYMFKDFGEHLTGLNFTKPIRFNKGYTMENYPESTIPFFYYMSMTGKILVDDFSAFRLNGAYNCVLSDRAVKFLLHNGVYNAFGEMINSEVHEYFENYNHKLRISNYSEVMPRLFLKDFI